MICSDMQTNVGCCSGKRVVRLRMVGFAFAIGLMVSAAPVSVPGGPPKLLMPAWPEIQPLGRDETTIGAAAIGNCGPLDGPVIDSSLKAGINERNSHPKPGKLSIPLCEQQDSQLPYKRLIDQPSSGADVAKHRTLEVELPPRDFSGTTAEGDREVDSAIWTEEQAVSANPSISSEADGLSHSLRNGVQVLIEPDQFKSESMAVSVESVPHDPRRIVEQPEINVADLAGSGTILGFVPGLREETEPFRGNSGDEGSSGEPGLLLRRSEITESILLIESQLKQAELIRKLMAILGPDTPIEIAPGRFKVFSDTPAGKRIAAEMAAEEARLHLQRLELDAQLATAKGQLELFLSGSVEDVRPDGSNVGVSDWDASLFLPVKVAEIQGSNESYEALVETVDGSFRVYAGSVLPDGREVLNVTRQGVELQFEGETQRFPVGE